MPVRMCGTGPRSRSWNSPRSSGPRRIWRPGSPRSSVSCEVRPMAITAARLDRIEALARTRLGRRDDHLARWRADPSLLMADAGLPPDDWQRDLLRSAAKRVLMLTTRQAGKSTTAGFLALRKALLVPGSTVLL